MVLRLKKGATRTMPMLRRSRSQARINPIVVIMFSFLDKWKNYLYNQM